MMQGHLLKAQGREWTKRLGMSLFGKSLTGVCSGEVGNAGEGIFLGCLGDRYSARIVTGGNKNSEKEDSIRSRRDYGREGTFRN